MTISKAWHDILYWIKTYSGEKPWILILAILAAVYLFIANKDIKYRMIIPILVLVPVVINPILYKYMYHSQRYWRFFWMLPDVILIGLAFADISKRINNSWLKCLSLFITAGIIILTGRNMFLPSKENPFMPMDDVRKLRKETREACEVILAENPSPKCVFNDWLKTEVRQYSGDITLMYARDYDGFIIGMDPKDKEIAEVSYYNVKEKDWDRFFKYVKEKGYTHLCLRNEDEEDFKAIAEEYGYSLLEKQGNRNIYHIAVN